MYREQPRNPTPYNSRAGDQPKSKRWNLTSTQLVGIPAPGSRAASAPSRALLGRCGGPRYVSLFPLLMRVVPPDSHELGVLIAQLTEADLLWTPFGLRCLPMHVRASACKASIHLYSIHFVMIIVTSMRAQRDAPVPLLGPVDTVPYCF